MKILIWEKTRREIPKQILTFSFHFQQVLVLNFNFKIRMIFNWKIGQEAAPIDVLYRKNEIPKHKEKIFNDLLSLWKMGGKKQVMENMEKLADELKDMKIIENFLKSIRQMNF